jgi:hypothetical protein
MSSVPLFLPGTPEPPVEMELQREARLAESYDAAFEARRGEVLEEFIANEDRMLEEAVAKVVKKDSSSPKKGKGRVKAREEGLDELTPERYAREMRSNGTVAQQESWRGLVHEVRGEFFSVGASLTPIFVGLRRLRGGWASL